MITLLLSLALVAPSGSPTLWRDIRSGMTYTEVQGLYPAEKGKVHHRKTWIAIEGVAQVASCRPEAQVYFDKAGRVRSVRLASKQRGFPATTCVDDVEAGLLAKYGEPIARNVGDDTFVWRNAEILVRYKRYWGADDSWRVIYETPSKSDL